MYSPNRWCQQPCSRYRSPCVPVCQPCVPCVAASPVANITSGSPVQNAPSSTQWQKVAEVEIEAGITVTKFKSPRTGMTVVLADVEGPLVNGFFTLATEAHDDDGLPHTLEHLVFLGSELFPYKGVLDALANRSLARGTNAWTAVDHTAYTLTCAGQDGFLDMLPVYLDHVLYPILTDSGCYTEVHHINGEGEDAGVVYCEMQGRENSAYSLVDDKLSKILFEGSGYASETGGKMANLREPLVDKIRQYHKDFYRPDNLCVVITGEVDPHAVFKALAPVEDRIVGKGPLPPMTRPWVSSELPPLAASVSTVAEFPDDDEENGNVCIGWRVAPYRDFLGAEAMRVLLDFLADTPVAPLMRALVEVEDAYCTEIYTSVNVAMEVSVELQLESVPVEKLDHIAPIFFDVLRQQVAEGIDMKRMKAMINVRRLQHLSKLEKDPHEVVADTVIYDFCYGESDEDLKGALDTIQYLDTLDLRPSEFWTDMIQRELLDKPHVYVVGRPSKELSEKNQADEKARLDGQRARLGAAGLKELGAQLESATEENDVEIPQAVLSSIPVPDISSVSFIPVVAVRGDVLLTKRDDAGNKVLDAIKTDPRKLNFDVQFCHVSSSFVDVSVIFDTSAVPEHLRMYAPLFTEMAFEAPIVLNGKHLSHEDVVELLTRDTISFNASCGMGGGQFSCGSFSQMLRLKVTCDAGKYPDVVATLGALIWASEDTIERLKISASKLCNNVADEKRSGYEVAATAMRKMAYRPESNVGVSNFMRQQAFLQSVLARCESNPADVLREFAEFRAAAVHPVGASLRVLVVADQLKLPKHKQPWLAGFLPDHFSDIQSAELPPVPYAQEVMTATSRSPSNQSVLLPVAAIESSYMLQTRQGPNRFDHPDIVPLKVLIEYLTTMEGPFWKEIRGLGFSYSYDLYLNAEEGTMTLEIYKASNLVGALEKAKSVVTSYATGKEEFLETELESARAASIFAIVSREETMAQAAFETFKNTTLKRVNIGQNRQLLKDIQDVSVEELRRVCLEYIVPLCEPAHTMQSVTTNPAKVDEIVTALNDVGYAFTASTIDDFLGN